MPPAPERLSTTTERPRIFSSAAATGRAARSACPPGGNATIMVIVRVGQDCATAGTGSALSSAEMIIQPNAAARNVRRSTDLPAPPAVPRTRCRSPPPCGEGLGVGVRVGARVPHKAMTPLPHPPPQGGRERTEFAAGLLNFTRNLLNESPARGFGLCRRENRSRSLRR